MSLWSSYFKGKKRWKEIKNNPFKYEKKKESKKRYYHKNKKILIKKVSDYMKELRELSLELGNCTICHKTKSNPNYKTCLDCRIKQRKYGKNYRERKKNSR